MKMKYLIVNVAFADLSPIVFREDIGHEIPALGLAKGSVDSAGFVTVTPHPEHPGKLKAVAWGRSQGLGIQACLPRDSQILTRLFNDGELPSGRNVT